MKKSAIYTALAAMIPFAASADVDFETTAGYTSVGVYDCWIGSPFRTGELKGNVKVVDNPDKSVDEALGQALNGSDKVLGAQRSRYGSNLFGVRVDLSEKIQLSTTTKYVHVMMHRPVSGRVALVALGKRNDRTDQTGEEEQLWVLSNNEVKANQWCDAVFPIKGSNDVQLYSLVVVPECESPHNSTNDFLFYVDDITVNDNIKPRGNVDFYTINYNPSSEKINHSERRTNAVSMTSPAFGSQSVNVGQNTDMLLYHFITDKNFRAKAGETVSFNIDFKGSWMHGYVYLDKANDGQFEASVGSNNYTPAEDLLTFSFYAKTNPNAGYNSAGTYISGNNRDTKVMPSVTLPADLKPGAYRLRFKMDWNDIDPGGCIASGNMITQNGGSITDVMLMVTDGSPVTVRANQLNGDVTDADGNVLENCKAEFGKPFTIKMKPAPGFTYAGVKVRHGVLSGAEFYHGNPQYSEVTYLYDAFNSDDCLTLPAEIMDGDVFIEGNFVEEGAQPKHVTVNYTLVYDGRTLATKSVEAMTGNPYPAAEWPTETSSDFYTVDGMPEGNISEDNLDVVLTLVHNLPFDVSADFNNASWYNVTLTSSKCYLIHDPSLSYISLGTASSVTPESDNHNAQWCFVGNAYEGFKIYNRGAGDGKILSSSTNTSANAGGNTYPIVKSESSLGASDNTYWIATVSPQIVGENGFYLHQKGFVDNRLNSRDNRLAYWTGGADSGSTFIARLADNTTGISDVEVEYNEAPAEYYNLQGIKVKAENIVPGIYIVRRGNKVTKELIR